jgi:hypothetical protein
VEGRERRERRWEKVREGRRGERTEGGGEKLREGRIREERREEGEMARELQEGKKLGGGKRGETERRGEKGEGKSE